jgi:CBS domain-containing protein
MEARRANEHDVQVVGQLMTVDLISVRPVDRVGRARDLLRIFDIHALPVMDGNEVVGVVTSSDLIDDWDDSQHVNTIMTSAPMLINVQATVQEAAELMVHQKVHHLLVTDEREVIGILSSFDLLKTFTAD